MYSLIRLPIFLEGIEFFLGRIRYFPLLCWHYLPVFVKLHRLQFYWISTIYSTKNIIDKNEFLTYLFYGPSLELSITEPGHNMERQIPRTVSKNGSTTDVYWHDATVSWSQWPDARARSYQLAETSIKNWYRYGNEDLIILFYVFIVFVIWGARG